MDFADPHHNSFVRLKCVRSFGTGRSRSDLFSITRCSPCAIFMAHFPLLTVTDRAYNPMKVSSRRLIDTATQPPTFFACSTPYFIFGSGKRLHHVLIHQTAWDGISTPVPEPATRSFGGHSDPMQQQPRGSGFPPRDTPRPAGRNLYAACCISWAQASRRSCSLASRSTHPRRFRP